MNSFIPIVLMRRHYVFGFFREELSDHFDVAIDMHVIKDLMRNEI